LTPSPSKSAALHDHIAEIYANAEVHLALARELIVARPKGGLDLGSAAHGFDRAAELGEDSVTSGIEDAATMQLHQLLEDFLVGAKCLQRALFVLRHQSAIRRDVGGKDRRQFAFEAIGRGVALGHKCPPSIPAMDHIEERNFCHRGVCRIHMLEYTRRAGRLLMTKQCPSPSQDTLGKHGG